MNAVFAFNIITAVIVVAIMVMTGCSNEQASQKKDRADLHARSQFRSKPDATSRRQQPNSSSSSNNNQATSQLETTKRTGALEKSVTPNQSETTIPGDQTWDFLIETRQRYDEFNQNDKTNKGTKK